MKFTVLVMLCFLLFACAFGGDKYLPEHEQAAPDILLYKSKTIFGKNVETLEEFRVVACGGDKRNRHAGDIEAGLKKLRVHAAFLGADAVVGYRCWTDSVDLKNNCWASQHCEGTAVKIVE